MTYETKNINFSCSTCESEQQLLIFENFTNEFRNQESLHHDCEGNLCKDWAWLKMCGALYQNVKLKLPSLFRAKYASRLFSSLVPQHFSQIVISVS